MTGASGYLAESGPRGTLRFFLGRPDPALAYGTVPAVLAGRVALAKAARVGETFGVKVAPILGAGALPFRGHVTLANLDGVLETFPGIRTVTLQSALRYDHGEDAAREIAARLRERLGGEAGEGIGPEKPAAGNPGGRKPPSYAAGPPGAVQRRRLRPGRGPPGQAGRHGPRPAGPSRECAKVVSNYATEDGGVTE